MRTKMLFPAWLPGIALAALAVVAAPAADKTESTKQTPADAKKIDKLIKELGSEAFEDREKAYKALDAIGGPALEALEKALTSDDAEIRKRSRLLVDRIGSRVNTARILAAKDVEFTFKDLPVKDAVAEIARKTGYTIKLHDPDNKMKDKKVTLTTGKTTFWNALTQFCEKAGLTDGDPNSVNQPRIAPPPRPVPLPGGGGGVRPLPAPLPAKVKPALPADREKKDEKKKEENSANAADEDRPVQAPAQQGQAQPAQAKPIQGRAPAVLPAQPPDALPGGGPAVPVPVKDWVNVQQGEIYLIVGKTPRAVDAKTSIRVRAAGSQPMFGRPEDKDHHWMQLELTAEPRLRWHQIGEVKITTATDDQDQKLEYVDPMAEFKKQFQGGGGFGFGGGPGGGIAIAPAFPGFGGRWNPNGLSQYAPVKFKKGTKESKSFAELAGTVTAKMLADAQEMLVVDNVMKMDGKSVKGKKGGEIKINKITKNKDDIRVEFTLEMPENVQPEQHNIPMPADLMPKPIRPIRPIQPQPQPLPADRPARPARPADDDSTANAAEDRKADEKKADEKKADQPKARPAAVDAPLVLEVPVQGGGGFGGGIAIMPGFAYNGTGVTLRDDKGKPIFAQVQIDFQKMGGFKFGQKKMEYVAIYKAGKGMPAAPAKLVFTARPIVEVTVPFTLKNVDLK